VKHNVTITALNLMLILLLTFFVGAFVGAAMRPPTMTKAMISEAVRDVINNNNPAEHDDWRAAVKAANEATARAHEAEGRARTVEPR
jgi:hypothetical protein